MLAVSAYRGAWKSASQRSLSSFMTSEPSWLPATASDCDDRGAGARRRPAAAPSIARTPTAPTAAVPCTRTFLSSSSFSALPPDEEAKEKERVASLSPYQKEMELRRLDAELARLNTLRAINNGELYTLRGKFKMLSREYGMGFVAWYWTVWFATAGLSYAAMEVGGVDPLVVAAKLEAFLGWEGTISERLDPTLGQIGLVVALNECLEPLRLPFVVLTTKPVVQYFSGTRG